MSDYTITTNFGAKDSLPSGNAGKVIKGSEFTIEFTNIQTAVATKADTAGDTFTGAVNFSADVAVNTNTLFVDVSEDKVGIGTTSPAESLHTAGNIRLGDTSPAELYTNSNELRLGVDKNNDNDASAITFYTNNDEKVRIDKNGKVGIGTTDPSSPLHLTAATNTAALIETTHTDGNSRLRFTTASGTDWSMGANNNGNFTIFDAVNNNNSFVVEAGAAANTLVVDTNNRVGVGTDAPQKTLHVNGGDSDTVLRLESQDAGIHLELKDNVTTSRVMGIANGGLCLSADHDNQANDSVIQFSVDGDDKMLINSSGNVGIGTDSPASKLHVQGTGTTAIQVTGGSSNVAGIYLGDAGGLANGRLSYSNANNSLQLFTSNTEHMRIDSSGNVLVGRTSGSVDAEDNGIVLSPTGFIYSAREGTVAGTHIAFINNTDATATIVGTIRSSGSITYYNTSSDERLKENITDSADAGSKIDAIQIRQFDWKADGSHQDYGVIAQELVTVAPEAVSEGDTEEDMMGVDYSKLVPMLIKEVQSLRSRVAELENN